MALTAIKGKVLVYRRQREVIYKVIQKTFSIVAI